MENGIPPEKFFYAQDGTVIRSVEELFMVLHDMPDHVFSHHVNDERNDFHNWISEVFENKYLAKQIKETQNKDDILKFVFVSLFR